MDTGHSLKGADPPRIPPTAGEEDEGWTGTQTRRFLRSLPEEELVWEEPARDPGTPGPGDESQSPSVSTAWSGGRLRTPAKPPCAPGHGGAPPAPSSRARGVPGDPTRPRRGSHVESLVVILPLTVRCGAPVYVCPNQRNKREQSVGGEKALRESARMAMKSHARPAHQSLGPVREEEETPLLLFWPGRPGGLGLGKKAGVFVQLNLIYCN